MPKRLLILCALLTPLYAQPPLGPTPGDEFLGPFPSWTNLKTAYGAIGDGIADDTTAFQGALDRLGSSPTSAVLYIPAGTYRITRTLSLSSRTYMALIGEDPATTTLKWDGAPKGIILNLNGVVDSRFDRLGFDGGGTAAVSIDQSWDGLSTFFDMHNEFSDDIFQNSAIGIRGGHLGVGAADSVVLRCRFLRHTIAAISVENWNALNWFIRDSYFQDNYVGVTNTLGAGNFHVYNSFFQHSARADMEITNLEYFSIRHNVSIGSNYFFLGNPIGSTPNPVTFQGNLILDPAVQAISLGNAGPVMLLDNVIRSGPGPAVTVIEGYTDNPVNGNVVSIGNTFTTPVPYNVPGRLMTLDDTTVDPASINPPTPAAAPVPASKGRAVIEVAPGASATDIQQAINTAAARAPGSRPIVHIPAGIYSIDQPLLIPAGADLQLAGDGGSSVLTWSAHDGNVLRIAAPSRASVQNLRIISGSSAQGILIDVKDDPGASVYMDQVDSKVSSVHNLLVEGLRNANVSLNDFYHDVADISVKVVGPGALTGPAPHVGGRVDIFGAGDGVNRITYDLSYGGLLLVEDAWYEGGAPGFVTLTDSGSFTFNGGVIYTSDPNHGGNGAKVPPIVLENFSGPVSILNTKVGSGGIILNSASANTQFLGMGVNGFGTPDFFKNNASAAQVALLDSTARTAQNGSSSVPDQTTNIDSTPAFIRQMLAELRTAAPASFAALASAPSDVRLFRVIVEQSTIGVHIQPAAPSGVAVVAPTASQTITGPFAIAAQAPNASAIQFAIDGVNAGIPRTAAPFSIAFDSSTLSNGSHTVTATATDASGVASSSSPVSFTVDNPGAAPPGAPFISDFVRTATRNNFPGWVGMQFAVGSTPLTVTALGRPYVAGNSATHTLRLVRVADGQEVPGGSVAFALSGSPGQFCYGRLLNPVILQANTSYYLLSNERIGGDSWYDYTPVTSANVASIVSPVYLTGTSWSAVGVAGASYVPVNFLYSNGSGNSPTIAITGPATGAAISGGQASSGSQASIGGGLVTLSADVSAAAGFTIVSVQFTVDGANAGAPVTSAPYTVALDTTGLGNGPHTLTAVATDSGGNVAVSAPVSIVVNNTTSVPTGSPLITDFVPGPARSNFTGWIGMKLTVGPAPLTVTALGRVYVADNTATHAVKLVRASDGVDVPGAQASVFSAGSPGQFAYAPLASPVTLQPGTAYYLVSQETTGGDQWYDIGAVTAASVAAVNSPVYWDGKGWFASGAPNTTYIPPSLLYTQ